MTTADPVTPASSATRRARTAWRNWRRSRPFWGGLLIVLGGGEILSTSVVSLGPTFRVGLGGVNGFLGTVIAFVLALCGLLLWFSPAQRVFYSIVAVVLALATFNTINYGGFFIGMLLGVIGGGLAFAWSPGTGKPAAHDPGPGGGGDRILGLAALPLSLPLLLGAGWQAQVAEAPQGGHSCILSLLCPPAAARLPGHPAPHPRARPDHRVRRLASGSQGHRRRQEGGRRNHRRARSSGPGQAVVWWPRPCRRCSPRARPGSWGWPTTAWPRCRSPPAAGCRRRSSPCSRSR